MSVLAGSTQNSFKLVSKQDYVTSMENCEFTYEWTIKNVSSSARGRMSPIFSSHHIDFDDKWILKIYSDFDERGTTYIFVDLQLQSFNNTSQLQTKCKILVDDKNEMTQEKNFSIFPEKMSWDISQSIFLGAHRCSMYALKGSHKVRCTITMSKKQTNKIMVIPKNIATQQLSVDWKKLLLSEKSADVTIQAGQKSFRAIKGILGARSPVFAAMFDHEQLKENKKNEVVIEDIEEDIFEEFLHYIYTGESPNSDKMAMELLAVAEKYQVNCLKNICVEVLCKTIDFENVASMIILYDKYNLEKLNKKCLEFMKENLQAILMNKTFQIYQKKYPEVFVRILQELLLSATFS